MFALLRAVETLFALKIKSQKYKEKTFSGIAFKFLQLEQTMGSTEENNDAEISVPKFSFDERAYELRLKRAYYARA